MLPKDTKGALSLLNLFKFIIDIIGFFFFFTMNDARHFNVSEVIKMRSYLTKTNEEVICGRKVKKGGSGHPVLEKWATIRKACKN